MHSKIAWDDLLYVLAVGRSGSLSAAARMLRVNHSTVFRRIGNIEEQLRVRLFDRHRDGYSPTTAGEAIIALAEEMDASVVALERRLAGEDLRPNGIVRLAASETLVPMLLELLPDFRKEYPEIRLELVTGTQMLNLTRRDADIALRATTTPEEHLFGRKLSRIAFAVYGSKEYLARAGGKDLSRNHAWIGIDDSLAHLGAYKWLRTNAPTHRVALVASSLGTVLAAAARGIGLALLPCYMARDVPNLVRCGAVVEEAGTDLWLLVHEDLRRVTRVRVLMDYLAAGLTVRRPIFEGST